MNETVGFLENIYMMDGYDLWLRNDDINLENVKEDINSKMKMDIISEMKDYNKRYASLLRSPDNTSLSEAYFSSNMENETKSYVKKFISGLNNLEINENVSSKLKDYAYKFMINSSRYLEEDKVGKLLDGLGDNIYGMSKQIEEMKKSPEVSSKDKTLINGMLPKLNILKNNIDKIEEEKENREMKEKQNEINTNVSNTSSTLNNKNGTLNASTEYYHKYVNLKKIMEDENNLSPTETLSNNIYEKVNGLKNSGTDMNAIWMKVQDNVPQVKGKTFQHAMVEFKNNSTILNNILSNL